MLALDGADEGGGRVQNHVKDAVGKVHGLRTLSIRDKHMRGWRIAQKDVRYPSYCGIGEGEADIHVMSLYTQAAQRISLSLPREIEGETRVLTKEKGAGKGISVTRDCKMRGVDMTEASLLFRVIDEHVVMRGTKRADARQEAAP